MSDQPLVSVGIPTYNRPAGLRQALECITTQTYQNLEIIISDNASPDPETEKVAREFLDLDPRIRYYRQEKNKGPALNFRFVFEQAHGQYFMWAADDDYFDSTNLIWELLSKAREGNYLLVFPNINIVSGKHGQIQKNVMTDIFRNCETNLDYLKAWCGYGKGYPINGLFDLRQKFLYHSNNRFDEDLPYYGEGTLLHKAFLHGKVRFVENVSINYATDSQKAYLRTRAILLPTFVRYTFRLLLIYTFSGLRWTDKLEIIRILLKRHSRSIKNLLAQNSPINRN